MLRSPFGVPVLLASVINKTLFLQVATARETASEVSPSEVTELSTVEVDDNWNDIMASDGESDISQDDYDLITKQVADQVIGIW